MIDTKFSLALFHHFHHISLQICYFCCSLRIFHPWSIMLISPHNNYISAYSLDIYNVESLTHISHICRIYETYAARQLLFCFVSFRMFMLWQSFRAQIYPERRRWFFSAFAYYYMRWDWENLEHNRFSNNQKYKILICFQTETEEKLESRQFLK